MYFYYLALRQASFLMVNSSWTKNHVDAILNRRDLPIHLLYNLSMLCVSPLWWLISIVGHNAPKTTTIVYPPCETEELTGFPLEGRERVILSVAQFRYAIYDLCTLYETKLLKILLYRPEKDHAAQLSAFAELLRQHPEYRSSEPSKRVKLVLVGGVRNEGDAFRVEMLKKQAEELKISVCTYSTLFEPSLKY